VTQHPPVHHPKNPVLGFHGWDETCPPGGQFTWSVFFFQPNFYSLAQFFFSGNSFYSTFFLAHPLIRGFFWEAPTYRPSSFQPTSLPHAANPSPPHHLRSLPVPTSALIAITIARQMSSAIAIARGA